MRKQITLAAAILVLALTGCQGSASADSKSSTKNTAEAENTTEATTEAVPEWTDDDQTSLYNAYVNVYNFAGDRLYDSLDRYFSYVEYEEEFVNTKDNYYCYSIGDSYYKKVNEAFELLETKAKHDELDESFLDMYPSLIQLMDCLNDIYDYTDLKSYLDDDYGKGKELHTVLWNTLDEYYNANDIFEAKFDVVAEERRVASLEQMKADGYEVFYALNCMFDSAQALQAELYEQEVYDENILDMNLEIIQPLYDEFVANVELVLEYSDDQEALGAEGIPVNSASWMMFLSSMKDTKKSMTEVLSRVKEGKEISQSAMMTSSITGQASLGSFENGISQMINHYNSFIN